MRNLISHADHINSDGRRIRPNVDEHRTPKILIFVEGKEHRAFCISPSDEEGGLPGYMEQIWRILHNGTSSDQGLSSGVEENLCLFLDRFALGNKTFVSGEGADLADGDMRLLVAIPQGNDVHVLLTVKGRGYPLSDNPHMQIFGETENFRNQPIWNLNFPDHGHIEIDRLGNIHYLDYEDRPRRIGFPGVPKPHRIGGPATLESDGSEQWYRNGKCYNPDGPSEVNFGRFVSGKMIPTDVLLSYRNDGGVAHRIGGPAIILANGTEEWMKDGVFHNPSGPSRVFPNGLKEFHIEGNLHRNPDEGPAKYGRDGKPQYWLNGFLQPDHKTRMKIYKAEGEIAVFIGRCDLFTGVDVGSIDDLPESDYSESIGMIACPDDVNPEWKDGFKKCEGWLFSHQDGRRIKTDVSTLWPSSGLFTSSEIVSGADDEKSTAGRTVRVKKPVPSGPAI